MLAPILLRACEVERFYGFAAVGEGAADPGGSGGGCVVVYETQAGSFDTYGLLASSLWMVLYTFFRPERPASQPLFQLV